jgi:hypothetical protein
MSSWRPRARAVAIATYVVAQLSALGYGLWTPDHAFGFQMFNESSRIEFQLYRQVVGRAGLVPIVDGTWRAVDGRGEVHEFRWRDRVRYPPLARPGREVHASYGLDAQLFRLQAALDDVAAHIDDDAETAALIALVHASRNGRPLDELRLVGARP